MNYISQYPNLTSLNVSYFETCKLCVILVSALLNDSKHERMVLIILIYYL